MLIRCVLYVNDALAKNVSILTSIMSSHFSFLTYECECVMQTNSSFSSWWQLRGANTLSFHSCWLCSITIHHWYYCRSHLCSGSSLFAYRIAFTSFRISRVGLIPSEQISKYSHTQINKAVQQREKLEKGWAYHKSSHVADCSMLSGSISFPSWMYKMVKSSK